MFFSVSKIKCDYILPLSDEQLSFDGIKWSDTDFMTSSLCGEGYTIEEDGQIYEEISETEHNEETGEITSKDNGIRKLDYTGEIRFNLLHVTAEEDLWVEFIAWVREGDLKEIYLEEWSVTGNQSRKEREDKLKSEFTKNLNSEKKWWYPLYKIYSFGLQCVYGVIKWVLIRTLQLVTFICQKIS
tara:strand:+ start:3685 stop:4239 length:555 start_codon:yes stop_codon:yes gene_type:complete